MASVFGCVWAYLCRLCCWQLAAAGDGTGSSRGMLANLARSIANQSEVESKFFCHICNACLGSKCSLITHIKGSHLAASMFHCNQCGASFKWYMQLHRHRRRCHGNDDSDHHGDGGNYSGSEYLPDTEPQWWQFLPQNSDTFAVFPFMLFCLGIKLTRFQMFWHLNDIIVINRHVLSYFFNVSRLIGLCDCKITHQEVCYYLLLLLVSGVKNDSFGIYLLHYVDRQFR